MSTQKKPPSIVRLDPIPTDPLVEVWAVFLVYGIVIGLATGVGMLLNRDAKIFETLISEPLSFYTFSFLSSLGFVGLFLYGIAWSKTPEKMHTSKVIRCALLPATNVGLSVGAAIVGMLLGLSVGMIWFVGFSSDLAKLVKLFLALAIYLAAVLWPMLWFQRMLFDITQKQEKTTNAALVSYVIGVGIAFAIFADGDFFASICLTILVVIAIMLGIIKWCQRR